MKAGSLEIQYLNKHNSANNTPKTGVGVTDVEIQVLTISLFMHTDEKQE